jgi:RHS repeat-associated protein
MLNRFFFALILTAFAIDAAADTVEYYETDAIGNVRVVTNEAGQVIERHDYLPFGEEWCGTAVCGSVPAGSSKRFTGKQRDKETGLDYFGARYYRAKHGRFTTQDPVYTWKENLLDPQRWNRYAYGRNNPPRYVDPDGREIRYANAQLQVFFEGLAGRSPDVAASLQFYAPKGAPVLEIVHAEAGRDASGQERAGAFDIPPNSYQVDYGPNGASLGQLPPNPTLEQVEDAGNWSFPHATLTIDTGLNINLQNRNSVSTALHELGHADQAMRHTLDYKRQSPIVRRPNGSVIPHDDRPAEAYANDYRDRNLSNFR